MDVTEEGTEAAATGAAVSLIARVPPERCSVATHPFLFIRDIRSGLTLFNGYLSQSAETEIYVHGGVPALAARQS